MHLEHADGGCGVAPEREERLPEQARAEVVEERGEPFPPPLPRGSSHAAQRLGHACPVLRPAQTPRAREETLPNAKARPAAERAQVPAKPQGFLARQRARKEARAAHREAARKPPRR